ncbi:MAG: hypothetical protein DI542_13400 [Acinetobacter johnsonii]|uniref:Uncharacterized protein n=1 Tax=Acinetobacter johnsonii TaxID=40214 RepID=A0A2W5T694_ACIJO|nr:MAG: hypothetical protein DI542_13400 [Acinetobacter johnsonii]
MAILGAELGGDPGSRTQHAHRQNPTTTQAPPPPGAGRGPTGTPTRRPAVATLGAELGGDPGDQIPAPARGPPAAPVHLPDRRQWPPLAPSSSTTQGTGSRGRPGAHRITHPAAGSGHLERRARR